MLKVYLIIAIIFILVAVLVAGVISFGMEADRRKQREALDAEHLRLERERLELERQRLNKQ